MSLKNFLPFVIFIVVALGFGALLLRPDSIEILDRPRPPFDYAFPAGEPVLVNFFASWCVPCRAEHELLTLLAEKHGLKIYGVAYKDKEADVKKYLADLGNPYDKIILDESGTVFIDWGLSGVPETFLVQGDKIRLHIQGALMPHHIEEQIIPALRALQ